PPPQPAAPRLLDFSQPKMTLRQSLSRAQLSKILGGTCRQMVVCHPPARPGFGRLEKSKRKIGGSPPAIAGALDAFDGKAFLLQGLDLFPDGCAAQAQPPGEPG